MPKNHGTPGNLQHLPKDELRQMCREGGIVSSMTRREKAIGKYKQLFYEKGIEAALIMCRNESWDLGYKAGRRKKCQGKEVQNSSR